jgi:hypothetical protein
VSRPWLAKAVFALDARLRHRHKVVSIALTLHAFSASILFARQERSFCAMEHVCAPASASRDCKQGPAFPSHGLIKRHVNRCRDPCKTDSHPVRSAPN